MKKKLLVVVDMQNDFIDGALGTQEARALAPKLAERIGKFDGIVLATQDTHGENYINTLEGKNLPVPHCIKGTIGWRINKDIEDALLKQGNGMVHTIEKPTFGSFKLIDCVADVLKDIDEIEVCGLCTGICVLSNACLLRAAFPDTPITVNAEYTECITPTAKKHALAALQLIQINVVGQ